MKINAASLCLIFVLGGCALAERLKASPEAAAESPSGGDRPSGEASISCFARLDRIAGLKYRRLAPHSEGACGYDDGVQLLDIGVPVPGLKAVSCPVAEALFRWVNDGVRPAARNHFGSEVVRIQSYGSYACRTRNSQPDARLSEHARANAVDVASFTLANGRRVTVQEGWRGRGDEQNFLRGVHRAGCQRFNIVIGPDADRFHQDHFHLDMGKGPYCR